MAVAFLSLSVLYLESTAFFKFLVKNSAYNLPSPPRLPLSLATFFFASNANGFIFHGLYSDNLRRYRPDCMVHGTDWRTGPLAQVRQKAIDLMAEWGGEVVEPEYTQGVSSSQFKEKVKEAK